jgi:DNA-binding XRE family transcriptional regulator
MQKFTRINEIMSRLGVKNEALAKAIGTSENSVSSWRNNKHQPKLVWLFKIAAFLNVPAQDLLAEKNPFEDGENKIT